MRCGTTCASCRTCALKKAFSHDIRNKELVILKKGEDKDLDLVGQVLPLGLFVEQLGC